MPIAQGVNKQLRIARQASKGTLATAGGASQIMRRTSSVFELQKETYTTEAEITSTQQLKSSRHGIRQVTGKLDGLLTPGTYSSVLSALLRRDFSAPPTTGAIITVTAASTSGQDGTFTRSAGSYLTDGFKVGMVVRWTGWATTGASNNASNMLITALTATVMTVKRLAPLNTAIGAKAAGDSVTCTAPGKVTYIPDTGHTSIYHTVEEWYPDITYSERNQDVQFGSSDVSMPGSGNATISFDALGLDQTDGTAQYFTAAAAETSSAALTSATGALLLAGSPVATVTNLSMKIDGKIAGADATVGANTRQDVFRGKVMVTGQFTAYFDSGTIPDLFQNETVTSIIVALTTGQAGADEFITFRLPQLDLNSATPDDNETGLKRTYNFVAEYYASGGAAVADYATTLMVCDSLAP